MTGVSALVCTRDRPDGVVVAATSLLANRELLTELIIVDQSEGPETQQRLAEIEDPRIKYVRSQAAGKGAALNEGLQVATQEIVVCTDDDCEAPPGWIAGMVRAMNENPRAAVVFSNVLAPPYNRAEGYIPTYERRQSRSVRSVLQLCSACGLGAGMALRRSAMLDFGGCDENMGPGGLFASGDDVDLAIRALLLGWHVCDTAEVYVIHHGFRPYRQSRDHVHRDWLALGAACSKSLRARRPLGAVPTLWHFTAAALWPPLWQLATGEKPQGLVRVKAFLRGFSAGIMTPVDRERLLFAPEAQSPQGVLK